MNAYVHKVNYYETDKMGITHHSNYVRWMEEARTDFLNQIGYGMKRLEAEGVTSPVVSLEGQYRRPTTFADEVEIKVSLERYTGARLILSYVMTNAETGELVFTAKSSHCFLDAGGRPMAIKKRLPEFHALLERLAAGA